MTQTSFVYTQDQLQSLATQAIEHAMSSGADQVSIRIDESDSYSVSVRNSALESFQQHRGKRMHIKVFEEGRSGISYTADLSDQAMKHTIDAALAIARQTGQDPCAGLVERDHLASEVSDLDLFHPWELSVAQSIELARELELLALNKPEQTGEFALFPEYAQGTLASNGALLTNTQGQFLLATSNGFLGGHAYSNHSLSAQLVASNASGMQGGYAWRSACAPQDLGEPAGIAALAAHRALRRLDARRLASGSYPVLFEASIADALLGDVIAAISGGAQYREQSFWLDCLGQQVTASHIDIIETPRLPRGIASASFDAEGVATRNRSLIQAGVLQTYLLDGYSARRLGFPPSGHAGGPRNLLMKSRLATPADDLAQLVRIMDTGLLVTDLLGGDVNRVTGDYSQGVSGFWVEAGVVQHAVEEITIAGNLGEMFANLVAVGIDAPPHASMSSGSVLIGHMRVAGF